jgi:hypothetical protein
LGGGTLTHFEFEKGETEVKAVDGDTFGTWQLDGQPLFQKFVKKHNVQETKDFPNARQRRRLEQVINIGCIIAILGHLITNSKYFTTGAKRGKRFVTGTVNRNWASIRSILYNPSQELNLTSWIRVVCQPGQYPSWEEHAEMTTENIDEIPLVEPQRSLNSRALSRIQQSSWTREWIRWGCRIWSCYSSIRMGKKIDMIFSDVIPRSLGRDTIGNIPSVIQRTRSDHVLMFERYVTTRDNQTKRTKTQRAIPKQTEINLLGRFSPQWTSTKQGGQGRAETFKLIKMDSESKGHLSTMFQNTRRLHGRE